MWKNQDNVHTFVKNEEEKQKLNNLYENPTPPFQSIIKRNRIKRKIKIMGYLN